MNAPTDKTLSKKTKRNIKLILIPLFIIYILFVGNNSLIRCAQLKRSTSKLEKEEKDYKKAILDTKQEITNFNSNKHDLERLAREKYLMRKANEDVFIIKEENEEK